MDEVEVLAQTKIAIFFNRYFTINICYSLLC
jgi:hypothetical protein